MCVSMAPAEFKGAIAFASEVDESLHLMAYQNKAQSFVGPNCMLLHVPTDHLSAENLVSTQHAPNILDDMTAYIEPLREVMRFRGGLRGVPSFEVVQYGAYEVVLASSAKDIPAALEQVSVDKRPVLNVDLLKWYDVTFPNYAFVLACFNNAVELPNHPILLQYQPLDPTNLFIPGLESHTGFPPVLGRRSDVDYRNFKVIVGSRNATAGWRVNYSNGLDELAALLPEGVVGFEDNNCGTNADYVFSVNDVRAGVSGKELFETMPWHAKGAEYGVW